MHPLRKGRSLMSKRRREQNPLARRGPSLWVKYPSPITCVDRTSLLLGTALASTLIIGCVIAPTPAMSVVATCPPGSTPIHITNNDSIICVNADPRSNPAGDAIYLRTIVTPGSFIDLTNTGPLQATTFGINAETRVTNGDITIENLAGIAAGQGGIFSHTTQTDSSISIVNGGDFTVGSVINHYGIFARTELGDSPISIVNSGDFNVTTDANSFGVFALTNVAVSPISVVNAGDIAVTSHDAIATGIYARFQGTGADSDISLVNSGNVTAISELFSIGLGARTDGSANNPVSIVNSGNLEAITHSSTGYAWGIFGETRGDNSPLSIVNSGEATAKGYSRDTKSAAIAADTFGSGSPLSVVNSGNLMGLFDARGIYAFTAGGSSSPLSSCKQRRYHDNRPQCRWHSRDDRWHRQSPQHCEQRRYQYHCIWHLRRYLQSR